MPLSRPDGLPDWPSFQGTQIDIFVVSSGHGVRSDTRTIAAVFR